LNREAPRSTCGRDPPVSQKGRREGEVATNQTVAAVQTRLCPLVPISASGCVRCGRERGKHAEDHHQRGSNRNAMDSARPPRGPLDWRAENKLGKAGPKPQGRTCVVDLNDVTFIDKRGERLLRVMSKEGAQFIANGLYIKAVLAGLKMSGRCGLS
jgi:hypothetical protein